MRSAPARTAALVGLATFALFAATAPRTITWWDGSHYPLLAETLSVTNPPGSLLLTLLGWLLTRVRLVHPVAFQLHLVACALGALACALVTRVTIRLADDAAVTPGATRTPDAPALLAGAAAGLAFAVSIHVWSYATQFTPYVLTACFTALLAWALLRWWDRAAVSDATGALFVLLLLFGLDVSVHRTNQLWLPAALVAVALRRPRALASWRTWFAMLAGYALGAATQLGYLALAARRPFLSMCKLGSLPDLWEFERLSPMGDKPFLVDLWPRRADLVHVQLADWVRFLAHDLGTSAPMRAVALAVVIAGAVALARRAPRLAAAMALAFLAAGLGAVAYFNRPVEYFRTLDRHYLPSWVLLAPWLGAGLAALMRAARRLAPAPATLAAGGAVALALVASGLRANAPRCDLSHTRYAETVARDYLEPLPKDAILVTNGDNDSFPLWYLQQVEGVRPDVLVLNEGVTMLPCTADRLRRLDPAFHSLQAGLEAVNDVIRLNAWRRPVYLATTLAPGLHADLLARSRLVGLTWHVPAPGDTAAEEPALAAFVRDRLAHVALNDPRQVREPDVRYLFANYFAAAAHQAGRQLRRDDVAGARETLDRMERELSRTSDPAFTDTRAMLDSLRVQVRSAATPR